MGEPYISAGFGAMIRNTMVVASVSRKAGGLFESVRRLALSLRSCGVSVEVMSLEDRFTAEDITQWAPISPRVFRGPWPRTFGFSSGLTRALLSTDADILHSHGIWTYHTIACYLGAIRNRKPYMVSTHGMLDPWAVRNSYWKKLLAGWFYQDSILQRASCLRALCESEAESMRSYGLRNPICIVPNGIDIPTTSRDQAGPLARSQDVGCSDPPPWSGRVPPERKVLLYLGRLHPKKGLPNLLCAWDAVRKRKTPGAKEWSLVIAGWDQDRHERALKAQARDLVDSVHFLGPQFDAAKAAAYSHAEAFVLPSYSEGLPMVILEAWAYGLPVLMTAECNLPEGFAAGAAVQVKPDREDLVRGLEDLFSMTRSDRRTMGAQGLALVKERFTWSNIGADMRAVYEWILGGGTRPNCVVTT